MTTVFLAPTFGAGYQAFTTGGLPLNAGLIYTYSAGTTTPLATYTTSAGSVQCANPIVLGADGRPSTEIWLISGSAYRFDLKDSAGNLIKTYDNLTGVNDVTASTDQWIAGTTATYVSATSFSVLGNQTATYQVGRRVKTTNTGGTIYGVIVASAFSSVTTVTVQNDAGSLDNGLSAVYYGLLSATNPAVPNILNSVETLTITGVSGTVTISAKLTKNGNLVNLTVLNQNSVITGTSNATTKTITGMSAAFRPSATVFGPVCYAADNAAGTTGIASIASTGVITLDKVSPAGAWTNSGAWAFYLAPMTWSIA